MTCRWSWRTAPPSSSAGMRPASSPCSARTLPIAPSIPSPRPDRLGDDMPDLSGLTGACDCHVHVIGPTSRVPLASPRSYTPMDAPLPVLEAMMTRVGLDRAIIVQPSIYGTDNSCLLDALSRLNG